MHKKNGKYAPCWCGSRKKYKWCHFKKDKEVQLNPWEMEEVFRKISSRKYCFAPASHKNNCTKSIVRAHSVGKSLLKMIAESGHVYGFVPSHKNLNENAGKFLPQKVGINEASIFTGFCSYHDNNIFRDIDNKIFTCSPEQCFLFAYRAISKGLFAKINRIESSKRLEKYFEMSMEIESQKYLQTTFSNEKKGLLAGLKDISILKHRYDKYLKIRNFSQVCYLSVKFSAPLDLMSSATIFPECDFEGNFLQDLGDLTKIIEHITFSSFSDETNGYFLFVWEKGSNVCVQYVASLISKEKADIPNAIVRMLFKTSENIFFNPTWWEGLVPKYKSNLTDMSLEGTHPEYEIKPDFLKDDGCDYVQWKVGEIATNCPELQGMYVQ